MKPIRLLICSISAIACFSSIARADDATGDAAAYKQKLHDCATQMKTDHPDVNHDARRKACRKQLGPAPKSSASTSSAPKPATAPTTTPPVPTP